AVPAAAALVGALAGWFAGPPLNRVLGAIFRAFNTGFNKTTGGYVRVVGGLPRGSGLALLGYRARPVVTHLGFVNTPRGFIPAQDMGYLLVNVQLPDSASMERTDRVMREIEAVALKTPGVKNTVAVAGQSLLLNANAPNFGAMFVMLDDFPNR